MDNKILVSILTHRCQCPHGIPKTGGVRGGATHIHKRKLSSEPHVKKGYKLGNHHFYNPAVDLLINGVIDKKWLWGILGDPNTPTIEKNWMIPYLLCLYGL